MGEVNASALPCNNHEGLLTWLPCYWLLVAGILSLRLADGGGFLVIREERKDERRTGPKVFHRSFEGDAEGGGGLLKGRQQVVVRAEAFYLSFIVVPEVIMFEAIETPCSIGTESYQDRKR